MYLTVFRGVHFIDSGLNLCMCNCLQNGKVQNPHLKSLNIYIYQLKSGRHFTICNNLFLKNIKSIAREH